MTPRDLLSAVRQAQGWPSNYALARALALRVDDAARFERLMALADFGSANRPSLQA